VDEFVLPAFEDFLPPAVPDAWLAPDERPPQLPPSNVEVL